MNDSQKEETDGFRGRAFVSALTLFSFIGMVITGLVLFVTPPGRVANWGGWHVMGLTKHEWSGTHIGFSCVFLLVSIFHIHLNWRPLTNHLRNRSTRSYALRPEWLVALLLCAVVCVGTLKGIPPFSSLLDLHERIRFSWEDGHRQAPIPHAELLSLEDLSARTGTELGLVLTRLHGKGMGEATGESILGTLAEDHGMTPDALYATAIDAENFSRTGSGRDYGGRGGGQRGAGGKADEDSGRGGTVRADARSSDSVEELPGSGGGHGQGRGRRGYGRMTLGQLCAEEKLDTKHTLADLQADDVTCDANTTLRDIATQKGISPPELVSALKNR